MTACSPAAQTERGVMTSPTPTTCELAARESDGVRVLLLWHQREDAVTVSVEDARTGQGFEFAVARACALDAFYHPFAYPPRDDHLPFITARAHERDARRRYQAAIAAAIESPQARRAALRRVLRRDRRAHPTGARGGLAHGLPRRRLRPRAQEARRRRGEVRNCCSDAGMNDRGLSQR